MWGGQTGHVARPGTTEPGKYRTSNGPSVGVGSEPKQIRRGLAAVTHDPWGPLRSHTLEPLLDIRAYASTKALCSHRSGRGR